MKEFKIPFFQVLLDYGSKEGGEGSICNLYLAISLGMIGGVI